MKLSIAVTVALVDAANQVAWKPLYKAPKYDDSERRVRGAHPQRRLQSVNKFMCRWLKEVFGADSKKAARTCNRITDMVYSHEETFTQKSCSFYDPEVKNGGPNPDPAASGKRRNKEGDWVPRRTRRQAAVPVDEIDFEDEDEDEEAFDDCDGTETAPHLKEWCTPDQETNGVVSTRTVPVVERKLKRYTTLLMKWCDRYIGECYGQRVSQLCFNRAKKLHTTLKEQIPE